MANVFCVTLKATLLQFQRNALPIIFMRPLIH